MDCETLGKLKSQEEDVCGICLYSSGSGDISRGFIDSCDHYFCFVCIMEWSKVESRCPICKRRFTQILRPPKRGVFSQERRVPVPLRDQVCYFDGNASVGPPNLYSNTKCSICHSGADESLLLLCDLCDIASHSYCIGLGATVPEGDWFCPDCAVLKAQHNINDTLDEHSSHNKLKFSSPQHVSTYDSSQHSVAQRSSTSTLPSHGQDIGIPNSRDEAPMVNARTLVRCRNVHDRIRALRANWNNIRNGTLTFTSTTVNQGSTLQKPVIASSSGETASSSHLYQPSMALGRASNMSRCSNSHEINKAWKMMDLAMTVSRNRKRSMPQTSNSPLKNIKSSKAVASNPLSVPHKSSNKDLGCIIPRTHQQDHSLPNKNRCGTHILGRLSKSSERMVSALPGVMSSKEVDCAPRRDGSKGETVISLNTKKGFSVSCNSSPSLVANVSLANPQSDGVVDNKCSTDKLIIGENDAKNEI